MKTTLFLTIILIGHLTLSQSYFLDKSSTEVAINKGAYRLDVGIRTNLDEIKYLKWDTISHLNLGLTPTTFNAVAYELNNSDNVSITRFIYMPISFDLDFKVYHINGENDTLMYNPFEEDYVRRLPFITQGYIFELELTPGINRIIYTCAGNGVLLNFSSFILDFQTLKEVSTNQRTIYSVWLGILSLVLLTGLILFGFSKKLNVLFYCGMVLFSGLFAISHFIQPRSLTLNGIGSLNYWLLSISPVIYSICLILYLDTLFKIKDMFWTKVKRRYTFFSITFLIIVVFNNLFLKESDFGRYLFIYSFYHIGISWLVGITLLIKALKRSSKYSIIFTTVYLVYFVGLGYDTIIDRLNFGNESKYFLLISMICMTLELIVTLFIVLDSSFRDLRISDIIKRKYAQRELDLIQKIADVQDNERNKIGMELHDSIGANLSFLKFQSKDLTSQAVSVLDDTIGRIRMLSHGLISLDLAGDRFELAIQDLCDLVNSHDVSIEYGFYNWTELDDNRIANHLYRILQELLNNGLKHSNANLITLQFFHEEEERRVIYEDNGVGFESLGDLSPIGRGMENIKQRVIAMNGLLAIDTMKDKGMFIAISFKEKKCSL